MLSSERRWEFRTWSVEDSLRLLHLEGHHNSGTVLDVGPEEGPDRNRDDLVEVGGRLLSDDAQALGARAVVTGPRDTVRAPSGVIKGEAPTSDLAAVRPGYLLNGQTERESRVKQTGCLGIDPI